MSKVWAIDFDGTLCENAWPRIGKANIATIAFFRERKSKGDKLILNTCREGDLLEKAIVFCKKQGLTFDAVNENLPERIVSYGGDCRKISADYYVDDKNFMPWDCVSNTRLDKEENNAD